MLSFGTHKNTKKIQFTFALLLLLVVGFAFPQAAHAGWFGDLVAGATNAVIDGALYPFKLILYYIIFVPLGWLVSVAVTMFEWAINPDYISGPGGILNRASIYTMWKFIRDFFNLFFILALLYTAFTIVFQVAANYKKTLLSIVLAALFINFSFPITRVIIDVTNVPMYYFVNQMAAREGGKSFFGNFLGASQIQEALIPDQRSLSSMGMPHLIMAIVMLFLFMISLLVLAVLMDVRLVALIILLIFSSVGFAASVIPAMQRFSSQWWDNLAKYALFGPAAMLMLYIATTFFAEIGRDSTKMQFFLAAQTNATQASSGLIAAMAMFAVPLIMMWFAIGMATSFSIAGAGTVTGLGQRFAKWAGKKTYNNTLTRGIGGGIKTRAENNKVLKFVTPKYWADSSKKNEERIAARVGEGKAGYDRTVESQHNKKVAEEEKRMEESRTSDTQLRAMVADPAKQEKATLEAAVRLLSKRGGFQNSAQLTEGLAAIDVANAGNPAVQDEKRAELIKKADKELFRDANSLVSAISHLGSDTKSIIQLVDKMDAKAFDGMTTAQYNGLAANPVVKDKLDQKLKKEGHAKVLIDADIGGGPGRPVLSRQAAYDKHLGSMSAEDLGKVKGIHGGAGRAADPELVAYVTDQVHSGNWSPKEHADAYSKLSAEQKAAWRAVGINP